MAAGGASLLWYQVGTEQAQQFTRIPIGSTPVLTLPSDCSTPSPGTIICPGETIITHSSVPASQPIDCQSSPRVGLIQCVAYAGHTCPETNQGAVCRYSQSMASPEPSGTPTGCKVMAEGSVYCPPRVSPTP